MRTLLSEAKRRMRNHLNGVVPYHNLACKEADEKIIVTASLQTTSDEKMVTIRMSPELHEQLKNSAEAQKTSMNRLVIGLISGALDIPQKAPSPCKSAG